MSLTWRELRERPEERQRLQRKRTDWRMERLRWRATAILFAPDPFLDLWRYSDCRLRAGGNLTTKRATQKSTRRSKG